jgi:hypothetical protein
MVESDPNLKKSNEGYCEVLPEAKPGTALAETDNYSH